MTYCQFHPLFDAQYYCALCEYHLCTNCCDESPLKNNATAKHQCFICSTPLDQLALDDDVEPFWRRLPEVYKYPISTSGGIVIFLTSFVSALLVNTWLLSLLPLAAITLYGFACLRETAAGNLESPSVEKSFEGSLNPIIYVLVIAFLSSLSINFIAYSFGNSLGILASGFYVITLPAVVMLVAITEKFASALSPQRWVGVVKITGASYFLMLLFLIIMSSSEAVLMSLFWSSSQSFFWVLVQQSIHHYYIIVGYHLLGYLVYQNHRALDFKVIAPKHSQDQSDLRSNEKRLDAQLEVLIKAGSYSEAKSLALRQLTSVKSPATSTAWHWDRCFRLMQAGRSTKHLLEFFPRYLVRLEADNRFQEMADAYVVTKNKVPALAIESYELRLTVAKSLFDLGRYKYTINLLNGFHRQSTDADQVKKALSLIIESFAHIPGMDKNEQAYRKMLSLYSNPV